MWLAVLLRSPLPFADAPYMRGGGGPREFERRKQGAHAAEAREATEPGLQVASSTGHGTGRGPCCTVPVDTAAASAAADGPANAVVRPKRMV